MSIGDGCVLFAANIVKFSHICFFVSQSPQNMGSPIEDVLSVSSHGQGSPYMNPGSAGMSDVRMNLMMITVNIRSEIKENL